MMKRMFLSQPLIMLMAILVVLSLAGCHKETEEDKIRSMIAGMQKAAKAKDTRAMLGHLSKTYRDPQGNDVDGIKGLLIFYFMKHQQVNAYVPNLDISIENNSARVSFQAVLTGADAGTGLLPEALSVYAFTVDLQKESGAWKITSAQWERIGDGPAGRGPQ